jgi:hypothetical protein
MKKAYVQVKWFRQITSAYCMVWVDLDIIQESSGFRFHVASSIGLEYLIGVSKS